MQNNTDIVFSADDILLFFHRRKYLIALCAVIFAALALLATLAMDKSYEATADVLIEIRKPQVVDIKSVSPQTSSDLNALRSQVELISSRFMLAQVVEKLNLIEDPEFNYRLRPPSLKKKVKTYIKEKLSTEPLLPPAPATTIQQQESAISKLRGVVDVKLLSGSYIIQIVAETGSAIKSRTIANTLAEEYLRFLENSKVEATQQANSWLEERLNLLKKEVETSEAQVENYKYKNNLLSTSGEDLTEQQVLEINQNIVQLRGNVSEKRARLNTASRALRSGISNAESLGDVLSSPVITSLRQQQARTAQEKAELLTRYGPEHPAMIKVLEEEQDIASQIRQEAQRIITSLSNEVKIAEQKLSSLQGSMRNMKQELNQNREFRPKLRQLEGQAESNRRIFQLFLERYRETDLQAGLVQADGKIISPAIARNTPVSPNAKLNLILGTLIGLIIGTILGTILEFFSRGIKSPDILSKKFGIKKVTKVPIVKNIGKKFITLIEEQDSDYYNALREIKFYIDNWRKKGGNKVLAIASSIPDEGKTITSIGLAVLESQSGQKVLLIDADHRKRSASRRLKHGDTAGIFDTLEDAGADMDVLRNCIKSVSPDDNLHLLPACASIAENIWNVLENGSMASALEQLATEYDLIILDMPPLLAVKESRVMSGLADGCLLVSRWRKTPVNALEHAIAILNEHDVEIIASILNATSDKKLSLYDRQSIGFYETKYRDY